MNRIVYHLGGWYGNNYGDRILQVATQDILREHYDGNITFVAVDNQKTYWSPQLIYKMNKEADMLLIGGGGFIMHRPEDSSHSGWQFNIKQEDVKRIQVPMVAYGLGYNRFPHDQHVFPQSMWDNVQEVINHSQMFSVRNHGTLQSIKNAGVDCSKVKVVPDPGMFIKPTPYKHRCLDKPGLKIGVNWATDRADQRFGSGALASKAMYNFFYALSDVATKHNAHIYLIDHLLREDRNREWKDLLHIAARSALSDKVSIMYDETYEELFPPFDYTAGFFADIYRQMDFVIGMRGHACLVPFSSGVPTIGLGSHNKVKWALEEMGMEKFLLDDPNDSAKVHLFVDDMINNTHEYKSRLYDRKMELGAVKNDFMSNAIKLINK